MGEIRFVKQVLKKAKKKRNIASNALAKPRFGSASEAGAAGPELHWGEL